MDTCEGMYSAPLAREAMRGVSGHPHGQMFYLPRGALDPHKELQR